MPSPHDGYRRKQARADRRMRGSNQATRSTGRICTPGQPPSPFIEHCQREAHGAATKSEHLGAWERRRVDRDSGDRPRCTPKLFGPWTIRAKALGWPRPCRTNHPARRIVLNVESLGRSPSSERLSDPKLSRSVRAMHAAISGRHEQPVLSPLSRQSVCARRTHHFGKTSRASVLLRTMQ